MPLGTPPCSHPPLPVKTIAVAGSFAHLSHSYATVVAQVDATGRVTSTRVVESSGDPAYDAAAAKAMDAWTFEPASDGCKPAAGTAQYAVGPSAAAFDDPCNHETTVVQPVVPDFPDSALGIKGPMQVDIVVSLDASGRPRSASISQSSGIMDADRSAITAAMQSTYFARVRNCIPQQSQYIFHVTFDPHG